MECKYKLRCTMEGRYCNQCSRNANAKLKDYFYDRGYIPTCRYGYDDCILDPAYLEKEGYEGGNCDGCEDGNWYDDEDK